MKELIIKTLMVKPNEHPKEAYIPNGYTYFKHLVSMDNYYICDAEIIVLDKDAGLLRNKEGALLGLKGNRKVNDEIIAGTFFIVGIDDKGYISSLSDELLEKYKKRFWNIENYTDKEVSKSYWDKFEETINSLE